MKVRYYSCCWLYRREVGRLGLKKVGRGNERAVYVYGGEEEEKKEEER